MPTPSLVAVGAVAGAASGNIASVGLPAGIATGHILVLPAASGDNVSETISATTGTWARKDLPVNNGTASRLSLWWSRYQAGDTAPSVTHAAGDTVIGRIAAYRDCVTTGDPFVATGASQANTAQTGANSTVALPDMTPGAGDLVLLLGAAFNSDTSTPLNFSGYTGSPTPTERFDSSATLVSVRQIGIFLADFVSDGSAITARTATTTNAAAQSTLSIGMAYALRGAGAAPRPQNYGPRRTRNAGPRVGPRSFVERRRLPSVAAGGTTFTITPAGATSPSGALVKSVAKAVGGAVTPTGTPAKQTSKPLTGAISPTGALVKLVAKALGGATSPTGALAKQDQKLLGGATSPTGSLRKLIGKALSGAISPTGTLGRALVKLITLAGAISPTGALAKTPQKTLGGSASPTGQLARGVQKSLAGAITPTGTLRKASSKLLSGALSFVGTLARAVLGAGQPDTNPIRIVYTEPGAFITWTERQSLTGHETASLVVTQAHDRLTHREGGSVEYRERP